MKKWQCSVCKYVHTGDTPPEKCPVCGVGSEKFVLMEETSDPEVSASPLKEEAKPTAKTADTATPSAEKTPPRPADPTPASPPKNLYERITGLLVKHHAHPVSVHFPNGILPVAVVLFVLAWIFNCDLFVKAGFINLVFVILALPLVLFSGIIEWKKKYNQAMTLIFKIKILAASITTTTCLISVVWYLIDPLVLSSPKSWMFILINILMLASAGIAGHIGGKLVFKD